jgi:phage terminase large subunit
LEKRIKGTRAGELTANALLNSGKRYICHEGGARSGKTYGIMQVLIWYANKFPITKISVVSHSLPHLKKGALRDFLEIMGVWEWYSEEEHNMSDNLYQFDNGSYIEFFGLEDASKARGPGRNILFVNEANLITKQAFDQLDMRTTDKVITDLNPADFDCWAYTIADGPDAIKIHSTYLDNTYLSELQKRVIESYRDTDPMMWKVFGLGERGASEGLIYTHYQLIDSIPQGEVVYGLDFGFNVPSALVRVTFDDGAVYVKEMLYEHKLTTNDLVDRLKELGISGYDEIFCDAAEPKTIEELYRSGFNAKPADKDVTEGIRKVKSQRLFINGENLHKELKGYKWKEDKDGKILDEPVKMNDHLCDAMRYAIFTKLKNPSLTWGIV